ncbi:MAG: c-type cytochrome, partial [Thiohalophilus sp.]
MPARYNIVMLGLVGSLGLAGCDDPVSSDNQPQANQRAASQVEAASRNQDMQQILRGGKIYQQNCAVCHGKLGQGAENWRQRDEDGKFPPPPLDGSGHT